MEKVNQSDSVTILDCDSNCDNCDIHVRRILGIPKIDPDTFSKWQQIVDILAKITAVPAALIMRIDGENIEVCISSKTDNNPYVPGHKELLPGSGLYCEHVIKTNQMLLVPNARYDQAWANNPDIQLGMISYLGFPIAYPNGQIFGTICILDSRENSYSELIKDLMLEFRELLESHLQLICKNAVIRCANENLRNRLDEIKTIKRLIPICSHCRKVRNDNGNWEDLEVYLNSNSPLEFSHGICEDCLVKSRRSEPV